MRDVIEIHDCTEFLCFYKFFCFGVIGSKHNIFSRDSQFFG
jgi:hypothetical protein